jgi:hypothetical protein
MEHPDHKRVCSQQKDFGWFSFHKLHTPLKGNFPNSQKHCLIWKRLKLKKIGVYSNVTYLYKYLILLPSQDHLLDVVKTRHLGTLSAV